MPDCPHEDLKIGPIAISSCQAFFHRIVVDGDAGNLELAL
jgi:hypothetical protein